MDQSPAMVPRGGPGVHHGDDLHGNRWRGGGEDFARQCETRAFGNARGSEARLCTHRDVRDGTGF